MPVPQQPKQSEIDAVPEPQLNPVLNPILAAHMGRWAEVYFTTLPEKREQAVSQLLLELQNEYFPEPATLQVIDAAPNDKEVEGEKAPDEPPPVAEAVPIFAAPCGKPELPIAGDSPEHAAGESRSTAARLDRDDFEARWKPPAKILQHRDARSAKPAPVAYSYRIYAGVVLVILLTFLLYRAWRSEKTISPDAGIQPPAPFAPAPEASPPDSSVQTRNKIAAAQRKRRPTGARTTSKVATTAKSRSVIGTEQTGVYEFVTAERYLKGSLGTTPDSQEAVRWLWKAVGDGNLAATMALSDLYLRGEGVPKSCDQARMLLDSAARKGGTAAAERLRHMQAFGCE
jgi:Sel1 repeat-containing protein